MNRALNSLPDKATEESQQRCDHGSPLPSLIPHLIPPSSNRVPDLGLGTGWKVENILQWENKRVNLLVKQWVKQREKGRPLLLSGRLGHCKAYRLCAIVELVGHGWGLMLGVTDGQDVGVYGIWGLVIMDTWWERNTGIVMRGDPLGSGRE